jgi:hypothetical protein
MACWGINFGIRGSWVVFFTCRPLCFRSEHCGEEGNLQFRLYLTPSHIHSPSWLNFPDSSCVSEVCKLCSLRFMKFTSCRNMFNIKVMCFNWVMFCIIGSTSVMYNEPFYRKFLQILILSGTRSRGYTGLIRTKVKFVWFNFTSRPP